MNLNKHKKQYHKMRYDGQKIITKGKKELYAFVYKRTWDLTQYDANTLHSYGLYKAIYVYIGSSNRYNLNIRCNDWKYEIVNNRGNVSKEIREFIKKLNKFLELETDLTTKEIDNYLYFNAEIIYRCESLQGARKLEKYFTSQYHHLDFWGEILEQHIILLSKVDSNLVDINDSTVKIMKSRNKIA